MSNLLTVGGTAGFSGTLNISNSSNLALTGGTAELIGYTS